MGRETMAPIPWIFILKVSSSNLKKDEFQMQINKETRKKDIYNLLKTLPMEKETLKRIERLEELEPMESPISTSIPTPDTSVQPDPTVVKRIGFSLNYEWYEPDTVLPHAQVEIRWYPEDELINISGRSPLGYHPDLAFDTGKKTVSCTVSGRKGTRTIWTITPDTFWTYIEDIINEEEKRGTKVRKDWVLRP